MSYNNKRNTALVRTLSKEDIHYALDRFGSEDASGNLLHGTNKTSFDPETSNYFSDKKNHTTILDEWNHLFCQHEFAQKLTKSALEGNLGTKIFRSICWQVFWDCLSHNQSNWVKDVEEQRKRYIKIRNKYVINPYEQEKQEVDLDKHHPLSQAEDSVWHKYFQDNELRSTIMIDLDRLSPDLSFFQQSNVKSHILHILFCYAREHPQVSYKQGMHEILGPIIYVMMQNYFFVRDCKDPKSADMDIIMDPKFIEHDSYMLFANLMEAIEPWYTNIKSSQQREINSCSMANDQRMFRHPEDNHTMTAISKKLNRIQNYMLQRYDGDLCNHLKKIDITPQLYGIRWIRLLYGREFPLHRLFTLWDALFAEAPSLDLVDYVYMAMLINLRGVLLENDFNNCLSYLMKYPENTDTKYILKQAISLKFRKPVVATTSSQHGVNQSTSNQYPKVLASSIGQRTDSNPQQRKIHPVLNRLGETREQMYAQSLGSRQQENYGSMFYTGDNTKRNQFTENKNIASERSRMTSQISSLKSKVGSNSSQIISRISNPIKEIVNKRNDNVTTIVEDHTRLQEQISSLQSQLDQLQTVCFYSGDKMDTYLNILQKRLLNDTKFNDEVAILSLAGLKQIREILKGGVDASFLDHEVDFKDIDRHIASASSASSLSIREAKMYGNEGGACAISCEPLSEHFVDDDTNKLDTSNSIDEHTLEPL